MPTFQLVEILTRIGLALAAGILVFIVPIALRKARFEPHVGRRVFLYGLAIVALVGFCVYVFYLWARFIPHADEAPAPIAYPVSPAEPVGP